MNSHACVRAESEMGKPTKFTESASQDSSALSQNRVTHWCLVFLGRLLKYCVVHWPVIDRPDKRGLMFFEVDLEIIYSGLVILKEWC